ncbi:MAG: polysaccharide biosynthesis C-terminal domain-containing protein [Chitinophagaceae bacterium]
MILIPKYLALGSAIATVAAQILVLLAHVIASEKSFHLTKNLQQWLKSGLFLALVVGINLLFAQLPINWVYALVISGLVSCLAVFPSTLLTVSEVRQFLRTLSGEVSKK